VSDHFIPIVIERPDYPAHLRETAARLAQARIEFAETFVKAKAAWKGSQPLTDRTAHEMSVVATRDALTELQAEYEIALWLLKGSTP
jgi:CRISPR/Cas system-associated protein Csm6